MIASSRPAWASLKYPVSKNYVDEGQSNENFLKKKRENGAKHVVIVIVNCSFARSPLT